MSGATDTIVLIHGLWMTPRSWEHWAERYRRAGYTVVAEGWPGMNADVEQLRADPRPIAGLTIGRVIDHYDRIITGLDRPPIIVGHSFGGAFAQVLLDRGLGAAGVAIAPAPVKGVLTLPFSTLRTGWPILRNPLNRHRAVPISLKQFRYRFTNHLSVSDSRPFYERYCVPAAGHVLFEGATANLSPKAATKINASRSDRAPLLLVAGGIDHVSPPSIVRSNFKRYRRSNAVTELQEFPGRSHFIVGQDGWEEIADRVIEWAAAMTSKSGARAKTDG